MSRAGSSSLGESQELSPEQVSLVREHLEEVLSSRTFAGSKRTQDFLRLIVRHTLEGDIDGLRERMIGAEMFGRPVSYDTGSDSVVRVRASEVRKKLALYYSEAKRDHLSVRIELPSGSYVPQFHFESAESRTEDETTATVAIAETAAPRDHSPDSVTVQAASLPPPQLPRGTTSSRTRLVAAAVEGSSPSRSLAISSTASGNPVRSPRGESIPSQFFLSTISRATRPRITSPTD